MKKIIILSAILTLSILSQAQSRTVEITPGALQESLSGDYAITTLTIGGAMDARDFACINENMTSLTSIDLSGCSIVAYDSREEQYMGYHTHFESNAIPASAFFGFTELKTVILPSNTTIIGDGAFAGCSKLTTLTMGDQIEKIGDYAFSGCVALNTITLPATTKHIGDYAFDKCGALTSVNFDACKGMTYIGKRAFTQNTSLAAVNLPEATKNIGEAAFAGCSALQSFTLPEGVTSCGRGILAGCSLLEKADFSKAALDSLPSWTFSGCTTLNEVSLPENITAIGEGAFYYCSALRTVTLPVCIEYLDAFAFAGCSNLGTIDFMHENLESIGRYAFYQNTSVESVEIPTTTAYIGDHAFDGCINAATFTTEREMPAELGELVFANMNVENKTLNVATASVAIYEATAQWQDFGKINGITAVEEVGAEKKLNATFEQYNLIVTASQEITEIRLYNTAGALLAYATPLNTQAVLDTQSFIDNIYLLHVTTADRQQAVTKVARIIR